MRGEYLIVPPQKKLAWVLVVEDSKDDLDLLLRAVRGEWPDYRFECAGDGADALDLLSREEQPPALILLDHRLPGMASFDLLRSIRQDPAMATIPVIGMSSDGNASTQAEIQGVRIEAFLVKVIGVDEFVADVRRLLFHWL
jgi:CheY-like chemotaxis protein